MSFPDRKTCPFCGSANVHTRTLPAFFKEIGRGYAVVCFDCFARGPYVKMDKYDRTSHSIEAKFEAVTRWNKAVRTEPPEEVSGDDRTE